MVKEGVKKGKCNCESAEEKSEVSDENVEKEGKKEGRKDERVGGKEEKKVGTEVRIVE